MTSLRLSHLVLKKKTTPPNTEWNDEHIGACWVKNVKKVNKTRNPGERRRWMWATVAGHKRSCVSCTSGYGLVASREQLIRDNSNWSGNVSVSVTILFIGNTFPKWLGKDSLVGKPFEYFNFSELTICDMGTDISPNNLVKAGREGEVLPACR